MQGADRLVQTLRRIHRRGYKAYKDIQGSYALGTDALGEIELHIDHVQGDPFAAPSKLRLRVDAARAGIPEALAESRTRRMALADFLARRARAAICQHVAGTRGSGKSGRVTVDAGGQEVLERTALAIGPGWFELRLRVGLPAAGRRVLGDEAEVLLCEELPAVADAALCWQSLPQTEARAFVACVENQEHIRARLEERGLVAFVADGAVLPRESGASDLPLRPGALPFRAPEALRVDFDLPNPVAGGGDRLSGLGIPRGVTLIAGGGYHGKSTLLRALERGVHPHVPGDGREYVVTVADAVKIRAEDGRRVEGVDIEAFIGALPEGRPTDAFRSEDASGSTSQAANIAEALEIGTSLLLLDEDTSATNFMVRDARMQALVAGDREPITPFVDRVRELHDALGVSTVLVMGGCGDYFDVADTVLLMECFAPRDATVEARRIAAEQPSRRRSEATRPLTAVRPRIPLAEGFEASRGRREVRIDARGRDALLYGSETVDLRGLEQLLDPSQTRAVGRALHLACERWMNGRRTLRQVIEALDRYLDEHGLDVLDPFRSGGRHPGDLARPRRAELAAALNRLRWLCVLQSPTPPGAPEGSQTPKDRGERFR